MGPIRRRLPLPGLAATLVVGLTLGGLLAGFEPVGGDPDLLYRPIKAELARALREGRLPYWSDRLGLGVPLVAESHVAAFYPPNWALYRLLDVPTAYRLAMWLHYAATAAATYAYARVLGITPWGAAVSAVAFALCGFQAVHTVHEPFYHVMPYLPLCLSLADRYAATGRLAWLAGLALAWGAQLSLGHFQIQMWTGGLVLMTGWWRVASGGRPWRRAAGLVAGLGWGAAVVAVQLALTLELRDVAGFFRPSERLANFSFPPAHWAQLALPGLFLVRDAVEGDLYWGRQLTTFGEACAYVGAIPLVLASIGFVAARRDRALTPWRVLAPLTFALASMPRWWPDGYWALVQLPGLGWFRAPARYTLITSLGLALLAGRGLDRTIAAGRFRAGLALAAAFGLAAFAWSLDYVRDDGFRRSLGPSTLPLRFGVAATAWVVGLAVIAAWRRGWVGGWVPFAAAAVELAWLFHAGPTRWGRSVPFPEESPIVRRLMREHDVGLVGGSLEDLPVRAGLATAFPYLGIVPPPPNYLLEQAKVPPTVWRVGQYRWLERFGVTHGVWGGLGKPRGLEVIAEGPDWALDRLMHGHLSAVRRQRWTLARLPGAFPAACVGLRAYQAKSWGQLYATLYDNDARDEAWFLPGDRPPDGPGPRARSATVTSYDGRTAVVEHDGTCDLVVRKTYYPGWMASVDGGPERPVSKANGGLVAVRLDGPGTSRVELRYRPTGLRRAAGVSTAALAAAVVVLAISGLRAGRSRSAEGAG